ncbi:hypothetical protein A2U01_0037517, partial [Trifolium medium]|nr:hypothetical protein [Trifolium medium]
IAILGPQIEQGGSNYDSGKVRQGTETCGARAGNHCRMKWHVTAHRWSDGGDFSGSWFCFPFRFR